MRSRERMAVMKGLGSCMGMYKRENEKEERIT